MPSTGYLIAGVAIAAGITFALRAVPFAVLARLRSSNATAYLARYLPAGIMLILVLYLLRDVDPLRSPHGIPEAVGIAVTALLYLWRKNVLLAVVLGTASFLVLNQVCG